MKVKISEILFAQGRAILLDVCGRRQLQNPDLLWGLPVVAGSKSQEERDGGRLSAGGEMPVIADADGDVEQERVVCALSAGGKCLLLWHTKMRKRRCTLS